MEAVEIEDLVYLTDQTYSTDQIRLCEKEMLQTLEFQLVIPTIETFLSHFCQLETWNLKITNGASYFTHLGLMEFQLGIQFLPSIVAIASLVLARSLIEKQPIETIRLSFIFIFFFFLDVFLSNFLFKNSLKHWNKFLIFNQMIGFLVSMN